MLRDKSGEVILFIGSGPIVIGQGAEFDYSGTSACMAIKALNKNITTVMVNSNPATTMTDTEVADKIYVEPLTFCTLRKIIEAVRPTSIFGSMGGQTGLNWVMDLYNEGILGKNKVKILGTSAKSIEICEDRKKFKDFMREIGTPVMQGDITNDVETGIDIAQNIGYPVVIRPAYTLAGSGGGYAENEEELRDILVYAINTSAIGQALIEKSVKGWKEIEFEIIRDGFGNKIVACAMENVDPVGIHTGDSIVVSPTQTLSDEEFQILRSVALDVVEKTGIIGGCNVQFAVNPEEFGYYIIEMNPRVSRSSALASKATGYSIAKISMETALGYNLDEIVNKVTGKTYACFEPNIDYCVVKIPKWPFDKFKSAKKHLGTRMMATGEVMGISNNFEAALMKAVRSLEINQHTLERKSSKSYTIQELKSRLHTPDDERLFDMAELVRREYSLEKISGISGIDLFFLGKIKNIILMEEELKNYTLDTLESDALFRYKQKGFSDLAIAELMNCKETQIFNLRSKYNIFPTYKMVDTCSGEFEAVSPYYYSTYTEHCEVKTSDEKKVLVVGSGPIRIGQGIEFDYSSVKCVQALKEMGIQTIIINNNPATVSTDFNMSDKLYFEPLTSEDVASVARLEKVEGVILQFGGQTSIKISKQLKEMGINMLGTSFESIDKTEDRGKFDALLERLNIKRPKAKAVNSILEAVETAKEIGYPILVRPSYVLGGQGMEIIYGEKDLANYLSIVFSAKDKNSVLIDKYLEGREIEVDAVCDGEEILIPGIMEHLNRAGVHSGDSISVYPSCNLTTDIKNEIVRITRKISFALNVIGMINIQFVEYENAVYVIEVNLRSSRTVPYISKVKKLDVVKIATKVIMGEKLKDIGYIGLLEENKLISVKVPVFSMEKLPMVEVSLGPEMRSTGEVLGVGKTLLEALYKGFLGAKVNVPPCESIILVSVCESEKETFLEYAKRLFLLGVRFVGTIGTTNFLRKHAIEIQSVRKISEPNSNIIKVIQSGIIDLIIDIPQKGNNFGSDGFKIRRIAAEASIPLLTSMDVVRYMVEIMEENFEEQNLEIYEINEIF